MRLLAALLLALPLAAAAQAPADGPGRAALRAYLDARPAYTLHSDADFEPLERMRSDEPMGPDFRPYTLDGDFNQDGYPDFAAIVFGPLSGTQGAWGDNPSYDTRVLVFNGQPDGTARLAVPDADGEMPLSTFLGIEDDGAGLCYGVAETDAVVTLVPTGESYDAVIPDMP